MNVSPSIFDRLKIHPVKKKDNSGLYRTDELLQKIQNRIEIYLRCEFVKNYENYLVSKNGEIYLIKGKIVPYKLKPKLDKYGYEIVALSNEYGKKFIRVHRVVALTYLENRENLPQINHKDGNKLNNDILNLEWCTAKYNVNHAYDNELNKTGIDNWKSSPVIAYKNNHEIDGVYENILDCSRHYNISDATIRDSDKNKTTNGRCGYYFRKITKEDFYKMKEDDKYESKIIVYINAKRLQKINQYST